MSNVRDFEADRKICEAATAGPWIDNGNEIVATSDLMCGIAGALTDADNEFIAEARTGWPAVLDHIQTQADEIERLKKLLHAIMTDKHAAVTMDDLRTENERYRQALEQIIGLETYNFTTDLRAFESVKQIAKEALAYEGN